MALGMGLSGPVPLTQAPIRPTVTTDLVEAVCGAGPRARLVPGE